MNYLAHSLISLEIDEKFYKNTMYGNYSGDFYKGKLEKINLPQNIIEGIKLHRMIDNIADRNENLLFPLLKEKFGIYKGIVSDIAIDHFLAKNFNQVYKKTLDETIKIINIEILKNKKYFSNDFKETFEWLYTNDVLGNYNKINYLEKVFVGMSYRVRKGSILLEAIDVIKNNYELLESLTLKEFQIVKNKVIENF